MEGTAWTEFLTMCEAMEDDAFELTLEEFAAFYAIFNRLRATGVPFDPAFVDRVEELNREGVECEEDGDHDEADERLDLDDGLEDGSDADEIGGNLNREEPDPAEVNKARTRRRAARLNKVARPPAESWRMHRGAGLS